MPDEEELEELDELDELDELELLLDEDVAVSPPPLEPPQAADTTQASVTAQIL